MGDMAEEYRAMDEHNKSLKQTRSEKVLSYLTQLEFDDIIELQPMNVSQGHYRVHIGTTRIDVWATTCKFTVVSSNKYDASLPKLKQLIKGLT